MATPFDLVMFKRKIYVVDRKLIWADPVTTRKGYFRACRGKCQCMTHGGFKPKSPVLLPTLPHRSSLIFRGFLTVFFKGRNSGN